jgi:cytochrome c oxidase subunit 1
LGTIAVDVHLHDTYFVVAHFHYVMMGSTLVAFLGALHYWWPKMSGRMYPERLGQVCGTLVFFGFNLTFIPQFIMGSRGMPRRYWDYDPEFTLYHQLSTVGALILGLTMFTVVVYLTWTWFKGEKAPDNPWGSSTVEWQAPTPPSLYNFTEPPTLYPLYNYDDLQYDAESGGYMRVSADEKAAEQG